jgi:hypothetical protein
VDELLRRMSSRELTEWMAYFTWKSHIEALQADAVKSGVPMSDADVQERAWLTMGIAVDDDTSGGQSPDDE